LNIRKFTDFKGEVIWNTIPARPLDIDVLIGDNSKAKTVLDWVPKNTLEEGLQKSINYWKTKL
jgi:nucleoside-diphosphate-sugar epimerase